MYSSRWTSNCTCLSAPASRGEWQAAAVVAAAAAGPAADSLRKDSGCVAAVSAVAGLDVAAVGSEGHCWAYIVRTKVGVKRVNK